MSRNSLVAAAIAILFAFAGFDFAEAAAPNIVVIMADDNSQ
jgi:hypothetical protein